MKKKNRKDKNFLSKPFTRKQIRREVRGAARAEYGPLKRQVKAEKRASRLQSDRITDYFANYDDAVQQAGARTASAYQTAQAEIGQDSAKAAQYAETLRQRLAKEDAAGAAARGASYDPSGAGLNAAAQLARINSANVLSGVTSSQGAAQSAYLADKRAIGSREAVEQQFRESQRRRSLNQDLRDIAKDKGAYKTAKRSEIIDRERDYLLGLRASNLSSRNAKADRRISRQSLAEQKRSNRASERLANRTENRLSQPEKGGGGGAGGSGKGGGGGGYYSPKRVDALVRKYIKDGKSPSATYQTLVSQGVDPKVARRAVRAAKERMSGGGGKGRGGGKRRNDGTVPDRTGGLNPF